MLANFLGREWLELGAVVAVSVIVVVVVLLSRLAFLCRDALCKSHWRPEGEYRFISSFPGLYVYG